MRLRILSAAFAALAMAGVSMPALALNQLPDPGFEIQGSTVGSFCYNGIDCPVGAWTGVGSGIQDETNGPWPGVDTPDGSKYGFVQSTGVLATTFVASDSGLFTLSWLAAGRPSVLPCCQGNQQYEVKLNGTTISVNATANDQAFTSWTSNIFSLTAGSTNTLQFVGLSPSDNTALFDRFEFNSAIPEPGTWALMIFGFGGVGTTLRSKRRRRSLAFA